MWWRFSFSKLTFNIVYSIICLRKVWGDTMQVNKTLEYYLNLNYSVEVCKIAEEDGGGFFASIPVLPGCMSDGETIEETYYNIEEAKVEWLKDMLARKLPIPEPAQDNQFSGRFVVRVSKSLHRILAEQSKKDGISLNQFIANSLAYVVGQKHAV